MIRPYLAKDKETCIEIFKNNCPKYFVDAELKDFEVWLNGQDQNKLAYRNSNVEKYFVIEKEKEIIGCGGFYIASDNLLASMAWGMIHHDFHKLRFGQELFTFRLDKIKNDFPNHNISLSTSQHTYRFFERFDFKVIKITTDGFGIGMDKYDMILKGYH